MWNVKNKNDTSNKRGKCNLPKVIYKISGRRNWKARHHGTVENSHAGHCAVRVPHVLPWEITLRTP